MKKRPAVLVLLVVAWAAASGCSVKARPAGMVPEQLSVRHHHPYSVMIDTVGTEGDGIMTATLVTGNDLGEALEHAIRSSQLFASVVRSSQADYHLDVEAKAQAPGAGFDMSVRVGGAWKLTDQKARKVIFDEFVTAQATKTMSDAFVGTTRVRIAMEAAMQAFIRDGIQRLDRLSLGPAAEGGAAAANGTAAPPPTP